MAHCGFGYPLADHAQDAGANLFRMLVGQEPRDLPCIIHCSWVLSGYSLSLGLPHPPHVHQAMDAKAAEKALADELKPLAMMQAMADPKATVAALDWSRIAMLIKLLLEIFTKP